MSKCGLKDSIWVTRRYKQPTVCLLVSCEYPPSIAPGELEIFRNENMPLPLWCGRCPNPVIAIMMGPGLHRSAASCLPFTHYHAVPLLFISSVSITGLWVSSGDSKYTTYCAMLRSVKASTCSSWALICHSSLDISPYIFECDRANCVNHWQQFSYIILLGFPLQLCWL